MEQVGVSDVSDDPADLAALKRALELTERRARAAIADADRAARELAEAQALASIGSWELDPVRGRLRMSAELCRMLGFGRRPGPRTLTRREFEERFPAAQRADFEARVRDALRPDGTWETEHMIVLTDGTSRVMVSRGTGLLAGDGHLDLLAGTLQDVTVVRSCEARLRAAFAEAPVGIAVLGLVGAERGLWTVANRELELLLGAGCGTLDGTEADAHVHPGDLGRTELELGRLARGESDRATFELRMRRRDGGRIWVRCNLALVRSVGGSAMHAIAHYLDISERKRSEFEFGQVSHRDALTHLFNRPRFEEELDRALTHARRYGSSGALIAFDLDGFQLVNEAAGQAAADAILVWVADAVSAALRASDTFARTGADEFAILLPDATLSQAQAVAGKILRVIRRRAQPAREQPDPPVIAPAGITASVGITAWGEREIVDARQALVQADSAVYEARHAGGDRYAVYGPEQDDEF